MTQTQLGSLEQRLQARLVAMEMCPAQVRLMGAALDRIAAGTYDNCLTCRGAIGVVRLTALPHASLCIPCQEDAFYERESGNVGGRRFLEEGGNNV